MSILVVDASVAAKWFFKEIHSAASRKALEWHHQLYAPDFLLLEFDALVCKRIRRREIPASAGDRVREAFRDMPIELYPFGLLLDSAYALAARTGCAPYDCLYVALAELLNGQVVTADRKLHSAIVQSPFGPRSLWIENLA